MNSSKTLLFVLFLAAVCQAACSGPKTSGGGGAGTGSVSVTMVADTLPAHPSLFTFQVTLTGITFTPSSGTPKTVTLNPALTIDLMRLQSDTTFLGTFFNTPTGSYTSVTLSFSGAGNITFLNDTNATVSNCAPNAICSLVSNGANSNPPAAVAFTVAPNGVTGISVDFNLGNAVSISGSTLAVNLSNSNVISAFTLPRQGSNLSSSQFDLIEDFSGVASLSGNTMTITSPTRGTLTVTASANTNFDHDPSGTLCASPTPGQLSSCVSNNQVVSVDAILNSDGTFSIQEIEPLLPSTQDIVEGIVASINPNNSTQFGMIVTGKLSSAASNSLITGLNVGDTLTVNIPSPKPFLVDTKGLAASPSSLSFLANQTNTTALHPGQAIAIHVTSFTAASGTTPASANADTVILRWSRLTATPVSSTTQLLNVNASPSYFNFASSSQFAVQLFPGTQGTKGTTNFDGIPDGGAILSNKAVSVRALFLENPGNTASPAFFAAKVRQH